MREKYYKNKNVVIIVESLVNQKFIIKSDRSPTIMTFKIYNLKYRVYKTKYTYTASSF